MRKPLYCSPSGPAYYALAKVKGKQIRASFQTNFIAATTHKLKDKRRWMELIDLQHGVIRLAALVDKCILTIGHQKWSSRLGKSGFVNRIKEARAGGSAQPLTNNQTERS